MKYTVEQLPMSENVMVKNDQNVEVPALKFLIAQDTPEHLDFEQDALLKQLEGTPLTNLHPTSYVGDEKVGGHFARFISITGHSHGATRDALRYLMTSPTPVFNNDVPAEPTDGN